MRDAFAGFCDALFNQELQEFTTVRLRRESILGPGEAPPASREGRVGLIRQADPACLLDLIYRFQFISDDRDYQNISSYVNNAPLLNQFVHEFIQNAEDAGAEHCRFVFEEDRILVFNNGRAFTQENLYAICSFRESDKAGHQRGLQIGKFGVGFKSVFRVSRSPLVVTWDESMTAPLAFRFFVPGEYDREYHSRLEGEAPFRFSPRVPESERDDFPTRMGYLFPMPVPLEGELRTTWDDQRRGATRGSMFFLRLRSDLTPEQRIKIFDTIEPGSFRFLRMARLEIDDRREGRSQVRGWSKQCSPLTEGGDIELLEIDERRDDVPAQSLGMALRMEAGPIAVPRDELQTLDILVREALPDEVRIHIVAVLDEDDLNDPGPDGSGQKGELFNGLPVPGVATGLNFHVDAPFNLSADRMYILDDAFNAWLIDRIGEAACRFLAQLRQNGHFANQVFRLIPVDLTYGGVSELTQRLAKVHDRLREQARRIGVLPAHDEGEPLRPDEALALRGADAYRRGVARAIQALIGGEPITTFAKIRTKIQATTLRLCLLPENSYEERVDKALGEAETFKLRWMQAALDDPGWRSRAAERNAKWYADLFTYICRGVVPLNVDDYLDIPWVPGLSSEEGTISPKEATLLDNASAGDLVVLRDGVSVAGVAVVGSGWRFAHPDFVRSYLDAMKEAGAPKFGDGRLDRLFGGRLLTWDDVVDRLATLLEAAPSGAARFTAGRNAGSSLGLDWLIGPERYPVGRVGRAARSVDEGRRHIRRTRWRDCGNLVGG